MKLNSESWKAANCNILVVQNKSQNLMSKDILAKLGRTLMQQQTNRSKKIYNFIKNHRQQNITKDPQFCIRLAKKNHIAKSLFSTEKKPTQHKERRVPVHLVEKVETGLQKLLNGNQIRNARSTSLSAR